MKISGKEQHDQSLNSWQSQLEQLRICNREESILLTLAQRIQLLFEPSVGTDQHPGKGQLFTNIQFEISVFAKLRRYLGQGLSLTVSAAPITCHYRHIRDL